MTGMAARRLGWLLRARGPGLDAWPAAERAAALVLLSHDAGAREMLADALAAEDAPDEDGPAQAGAGPGPGAGATDAAALQRIRRHVHKALAPLPPMLRAIGMGALAACAAAGLYVGLAPMESEFGHALAPTIQATNPATVLAALVP